MQAGDGEAEGISLLDLLIVIAKHKKLILGIPLIATILAAIYAMSLPAAYTATTKIFTPQQNQSAASAMLAQLGNLGGLAGGLAGVKNPNDLYIGMLKSRTVADNLIQRFDIVKLSKAKYPTHARDYLARATNISSGKDGTISIEVDAEDPKFAAILANAYVDELFKFTRVLAVTENSQRRLFFERQLLLAKDNLIKAETTAREAIAQGGLVKVDDQGRVMVESIARLRAQMSVKEVQIGAMRSFAAERNPELRRAQQELESMKQELAKLEGTGGAKAVEATSGGKGMDNLRLLRDLKYYETIYELIAKQYELAKIEEAKDSSVIQVMDKAIEPDIRSKPKRKQIVFVSGLVSLIAGIVLAFVLEAMARNRNDPKTVEQLQAFKRHLGWR